MKLLNNTYGRVLTAVLLLQGAAFYALASRREDVPKVPPLALFPAAFGDWHMEQDFPIEKEVQDVLRADDTLNRQYVDSSQSASTYLFVAFFKTQRSGQAPHSPKNCLPGSGWEPVEPPRTVSIGIPGRAAPFEANRYVVAHGDDKSVVLYWYQSHNRVIASEYAAKFWLVADSIRYHRSDTALVKIVVPVRNGDTASATETGVAFVQALFPELERQLPLWAPKRHRRCSMVGTRSRDKLPCLLPRAKKRPASEPCTKARAPS